MLRFIRKDKDLGVGVKIYTCNIDLRKEAIIFRRAMRQVPRDELDLIISRIAAYNKDEFSTFMKVCYLFISVINYLPGFL